MAGTAGAAVYGSARCRGVRLAQGEEGPQRQVAPNAEHCVCVHARADRGVRLAQSEEGPQRQAAPAEH